MIVDYKVTDQGSNFHIAVASTMDKKNAYRKYLASAAGVAAGVTVRYGRGVAPTFWADAAAVRMAERYMIKPSAKG